MVHRIRIFAGPNGSGKTELYKGLRNKNYFNEYCYINADEIQKQLITGKGFNLNSSFNVNFELTVIDIIEEFNNNGFSTKVDFDLNTSDFKIENTNISYLGNKKYISYIASTIAELLRKKLIKNKASSFSFETVLSHPSKIELLHQAKKSGFKIYSYFITTEDPSINQQRVQERIKNGGHSVPNNKIKERYYRTMKLLPELVAISDQAYIFDNSNSIETGYNLIAKKKENNLNILVDEIPQWLLSYLINPLLERPTS